LDRYFSGDTEEEFSKLYPNESMIDDPVERIVQINKIKFKIKSENEEREKLKKIKIENKEKEER
jgi:hypothetical protein